MNIIIKPVGLLCIAGTFGVLVVLLAWKFKSAPTGGNSAVAQAAQPSTDTAARPTGNSASPAATTQTALSNGVLLAPDIASNEWQKLLTKGQTQISVVPATVAGHPFARRIAMQTTGAHPWDIQIAHPLNVALRGGKHIQMSFWARSAESCPISAVVEQYHSPYTRVIAKEEALTPEGTQYKEEWVQQSDTQDNWAKMDFQVSYKPGTVEITGVTIQQIDG